jgi:hypothetical protein
LRVVGAEGPDLVAEPEDRSGGIDRLVQASGAAR